MADASNSQDNKDTELTMCDVLEEEQELEEDANAVLGGSDDTNCSYDKGYVPRQALYACTTCTSNQEPSGVCLACSYKCHDGHDIVELYTKRNFRCDCGNSKFPGKTCSLKPDKDEVNPLNKYNHNFKGLYCSCSRPYPDLEDDTPDEMIQCVMCEDWYHGRHIGRTVPDDYSEMICAKCMQSHKFLYSYLNKYQYVNVSENQEENSICNSVQKIESSDIDIKTEKEAQDQHDENKSKVEMSESSDVQAALNDLDKERSFVKEIASVIKHEEEIKQEPSIKMEKADDCLLNELIVKPDSITTGPAFWPENWRKDLCRCSSCISMYMQNQCSYLINLDDTILAYEEKGKHTNESQYVKGLSALSQLDRVKQMEAIRAYTSMKGQLKEYLQDFAINKRTVCESDIKEFFDRISKRQKLSNGVPHFCR